MKLAGVGRVRKPRYTLGDVVRVKDLPWIEGPVTKKAFRPYESGSGWWSYKVGQGKWWNEGSLRKVPVRRKKR